MIRRKRRVALELVAALFLLPSVAGSQSIQKWIKPDGGVHYGEHAPPGSKLVGETESLGTSGGGDVGSNAAAANARGYSSTSWYEGAAGYADALARQKTSHAPVLVYFRTDWCPHCRKFDGLLEEQSVREALSSTIKVRINPELGEDEQAIFASEFQARSFPSVFLIAPNGSRRKVSHSGPAERFLAQLPD